VQVAVLDARPQHHHLYNSGSGGVAQAEGHGPAGESDMRVEVVAGLRELALTRAVCVSVYPSPPPLGFSHPAAYDGSDLHAQ
jgi:hypothetical protein